MKNNDFQDIEQELIDLGEKMALAGVAYVQNNLQVTSEKILENYFYNKFTPFEYDRTKNLLRGSYHPYQIINKGLSYEGGVEIDASGMAEYPEELRRPNPKIPEQPLSNDQIVEEAWFKGSHGKWKTTSPIPFDKEVEYINSGIFESFIWRHIRNSVKL